MSEVHIKWINQALLIGKAPDPEIRFGRSIMVEDIENPEVNALKSRQSEQFHRTGQRLLELASLVDNASRAVWGVDARDLLYDIFERFDDIELDLEAIELDLEAIE